MKKCFLIPVFVCLAWVSSAQLNNITETAHNITLHFSPSGPEYYIFLVSADTVIERPVTDGTQFNLTDGYYDLICFDYYADDLRFLLNRLHVYRDMDTTLSLSSADNQVELQIKDENGNLVLPGFRTSGNGVGLIFEHSPGSKVPYTTYFTRDSNITSLMLSQIPSSMKLLLSRSTIANGTHYKSYIINYPVLSTLPGYLLLTNESADLRHLPIVFHPTPAGSDYYWNFAIGYIGNSSVTGYVDSFLVSILTDSLTATPTDTIEYYANRIQNDSVIGFYINSPIHSGIPLSLSLNSGISAGLVFPAGNDDDMVFSMQGNYPPVSDDIRISPGEKAELGSGTPFNYINSYNTPGSQYVYITTYHRGMMNERRFVDSNYSTYQIWQYGELISGDTIKALTVQGWVPYSDTCKVIITDQNYTVAGMPGIQVSEIGFNLSNPVDVNSPHPISFMILQGDSLVSEITHGDRASVRFTAGDYSNSDRIPFTLYESVAEVTLYYKDHNAEEWTPLEVTAVTDELDSLAGMPYYADLAPLMTAADDSTWIDLKLSLTDSAGNTNIQTFKPAFLFNDITAGSDNFQATRNNFYPNPTRNILHFGGEAAKLAIFSLEGRQLADRQKCTYIDITSLKPGIYIARVIDNKGEVRVSKVIKL